MINVHSFPVPVIISGTLFVPELKVKGVCSTGKKGSMCVNVGDGSCTLNDSESNTM